ncbi:MAG: TonB-dependent receptor, partial [Gammaproteobacteria bacterium]|nr:TonB-dependent receptor [Gammaproteobacteria bacterium]
MAGVTFTSVYAGELEEVIVTATKRAESVQDISTAVTAVNTEALEMGGIVDPKRLGLIVPGLQVGYSGGEARFAIRGSRTNSVGPGFEQVVGVFEDGIYQNTTSSALSSYLDVNRVEVLRGPQGTLYGRNTFAGAINIHNNEPNTDEVEGHIKFQYGDYSETRIEGVVNLPVSDTFAVRVAALTDTHDGYIENTFSPGTEDDLHDKDSQLWRVTAKWDATDKLSATLRISGSDDESNGSAIWGYRQIGCYRNDGDATTASGNAAVATFVNQHCYQPGTNNSPSNLPIDPNDPNAPARPGIVATQQDAGPYSISRNTPSALNSESSAINLQFDYDMDWATLKFIGAQSNFKNLQYYDTDYSDGSFQGSDNLNNGFGGYDQDEDTTSLEVQLASNGEGMHDWVAGIYSFTSENDWGFGFLSNGAYVPYGSNRDTFDADALAVFGEGSYSISDRTRIIAGLRWNEDTRTRQGASSDNKWTKTTYKAGFEYDRNEDSMLYGTVSTGYRVGGINGSG